MPRASLTGGGGGGGSAIRRDFGAQRARFVATSVCSAVGSSRFQRTAPAVRRFLMVGRTFHFALALSEFASGEHASVVSAPARLRWLVSRGGS